MELSAQIKLAETHEKRIDDVISNCPSMLKKNNEPPRDHTPKIELRQVTILSNGLPLLSIDSLSIDSAKTILVQGGNATGKTLLLRTIARLNSNYLGSVIVDGMDQRDYSETEYFNRVLYVSSDQAFVADTLQEELSNCEYPGNGPLDRTTKSICFDRILQNLPCGMTTKTNILPALLNNGSIQILRMLRALSKNPEILLLDEVLSNIDNKTCVKLINAIREYYPNLILIIVEHHYANDLRFDVAYEIEVGC